MQAKPVDLIERLRNAGDDGSADSIADIARSLALVKRYFEELTPTSKLASADSPEGKCLDAINAALGRIHRPL